VRTRRTFEDLMAGGGGACRRALALVAVVTAAALGTMGGAAQAAAPQPGLWVGRKGDVQISFTVNRAGGRSYVANTVLACRGSGFADLPDGQRDSLGDRHRFRIEAGGRVPSWPYRAGSAPRLGARRGLVSSQRIGPSSSTAPACPAADARNVHMRRVAARPVRDGEYHALGDYRAGADEPTFEFAPDFVVSVYGGGVLAVIGPGRISSLGFPDPSDPGKVCLMPEAWGPVDALLGADGAFAASGTAQREFTTGDAPTAIPFSFSGSFPSPTRASGSYSASNLGCGGVLGDRSVTLSQGFSARPLKLFRDGAPVGRAPAKPAPPPAPPAKPGRALGAPQPGNARGCTAKVKTGSVEALSSCFRVHGGIAVAHDRVRLNGIDLLPASAGAIRIDIRAARLSTDGPVWVVAGGLRLGRLRPKWDLARSALFTAETPEKPEESEGETKESVPKGRKLGGLLALTGSVELTWEPGKTKGKVTVGFPETVLSNAVSGEASFSATNDRGLVLEGAKASFPTVVWGRAELRDVAFSYTRTDEGANRWDGGMKLYFPGFQRFQGIKLEGGFDDHGYRRFTGGVDGLNTSLAYGVFLQRLESTLGFSPFALGGSAGFTYGPQFKLPREEPIAAISLDAGLLYENANPDSFAFTGKGKVAGRIDIDGKVKVLSTGSIDADGSYGWELGSFKVKAQGSGWLADSRFDVQGTSRFSLARLQLSGDWVLSSLGLAACHHGFGPDFGVGYRWGGDLQVMNRGCGIGPWTIQKPAGAAAAAAPSARFRVPAGRRVATFSAVGRDAPPQVTLTGPHGARVDVPAEPDAATLTRDAATVKDPAARTTYLAVRAPAAGVWTLAATPGSSPVVSLRSALARPAVRIRARVVGRGRAHVLRYRARRLAGGRLLLYEQGRDARRVLARSAPARGRIRFLPARGRGGRRSIRAVVVQDGIPQPAVRVARYRARGVARAARPRGLRVRRTRSAAIVRWAGRRGRRYLLTARGSDGRRTAVSVAGRRPRVRIDALPRSVRLHVAVRQRNALGRLGAAARSSRR
jgi:hypothetical protein